MNIFELEQTLPNGFHDSLIHNIELDYKEKTAILTMSIDESDCSKNKPNKYKKIKLLLRGIQFFGIDLPDPGYPYLKDNALWVDLSEIDKNESQELFNQPQNVFMGRFFVIDWNSFINFAAEDAEIINNIKA